MFAIPLVGTFAAGILGYTYLSSSTDNNAPLVKAKNGDMLPIRQVVLFNSGVGYFQREGEVDGDARIELSLSRQRHQRSSEKPGPAGLQGPDRHRQLRQPAIPSTRSCTASPSI